MYSCIPFTCLLLDVCTMIYAIILFVWVSRIPFTCLLLCACHHIMEHYLCVVVITIILVHLFAKSHGPPYLIILLYVAVYYSLVCLYARTVVFYNIILYVVVQYSFVCYYEGNLIIFYVVIGVQLYTIHIFSCIPLHIMCAPSYHIMLPVHSGIPFTCLLLHTHHRIL